MGWHLNLTIKDNKYAFNLQARLNRLVFNPLPFKHIISNPDWIATYTTD